MVTSNEPHMSTAERFQLMIINFLKLFKIKEKISEVEKLKALEKEKDEIQKFLEDKNAEIVVVLEGVDPMTSHNVQSYHSYVSEEIKWDHFFVNCASVVNGKLTVVYNVFYALWLDLYCTSPQLHIVVIEKLRKYVYFILHRMDHS
jgi:GTPase involved in cell partitioning and DNA repair